MLSHAPSAEAVDLLYETVEELAVVRDYDDRAVEGCHGLLEDILRAQVQVVGGLVENEEVHGLEKQFYHCQARPFAAREHLHLLVGGFAAEHESAEDVANAGAYVAASHAVDGVEHGELGVEQLCLILCEITDLRVVSHLKAALERNLTEDTFDERRLALAVAPHEGHLLAAADGEVDVGDYGVLVALAQVLHDEREIARTLAGRELQVEGRVVDLVDLYRHNTIELLDALLHLHGLRGLIAEALDEVLEVCYFLLLVLVGAKLLFAPLGAQAHVFVVLDFVVPDAAAGDLERASGDVIDEGAVVRDQYHGPGALLQILLEPLYALDVEVVGGLVEEQHVGLSQQQLCQLDAHTPAARELTRGPVEIAALEAEAGERALNLGAEVQAAQHLEALLGARVALDEGHVGLALIVGALAHLGLHALDVGLQIVDVLEGQQRLIDHRAVAGQFHHLWQIAHRGAARRADRAGCGALLPCHYLQQCRLARTVLAGKGYAVAVVHDETDVGEQRLGTEFYGKMLD